MRMRMIVAALSLFCAVSVGQTSHGPQPDPDRSPEEQTVAILLADNGQAPIPGFVQTLVNRMGDDAAIGVVQYLGDRKATASVDPTSPQEIERILAIIRMAFAAPNIVQPERARIPKASLVLLKYLTCLPAAGLLRNEIDSTSRVVEDVKVRPLKERGHPQ